MRNSQRALKASLLFLLGMIVIVYPVARYWGFVNAWDEYNVLDSIGLAEPLVEVGVIEKPPFVVQSSASFVVHAIINLPKNTRDTIEWLVLDNFLPSTIVGVAVDVSKPGEKTIHKTSEGLYEHQRKRENHFSWAKSRPNKVENMVRAAAGGLDSIQAGLSSSLSGDHEKEDYRWAL